MASKAGVQGSVLNREFPRCCFFPLPWSLLVGCSEKVDQGFTQHLVSQNPEEKQRTVVVFWNKVSQKSEGNFYWCELSNFWDRMSYGRRWALGNVAIGVSVLWGTISCRGQGHQLFTESIAQIQPLEQAFPVWHLSGSVQLPALCPCHVLCSHEGQEGDWAWLLPPWEAHSHLSWHTRPCAPFLCLWGFISAPAWPFRACPALLFGVSRISPPCDGELQPLGELA